MNPAEPVNRDYDVLVVGAGTSGMEASLSLGEMGYRVLLVDKAPSIGGKTILLSKVFPTLDCASCISTPKMAAAAHHPNVSLRVSSQVEKVERAGDRFSVTLRKQSTSVHPDKCTGCAECEKVCTVAVPDQYNYGLVARRAAHIPFPQAIPKKAVVDKRGTAPCQGGCPAGVHASGFVSLVRSGKYREAFLLHLEDAPLVGTLSRACYAPCEGECSRSEWEGPVNIRAVKRFMVDHYYAGHPEPEHGPVSEPRTTRVAIVGSGPAGLTAAFYLARAGHRVTIFEAEAEAGGMLRYGIPAYRLPKDVLDRDIKNITAWGVEIKTSTRVASLKELRAQGFDGVVVAVGGQVPRLVSIEGLTLVNQDDCMNFLRASGQKTPEIKNKQVVVIGGGNVAMDVARSAVRLGAARVTVLCLECRADMPAHSFEVKEAEEEGVIFHPAAMTNRIYTSPAGTQLEFLRVDEFKIEKGKPVIRTRPGSEQSILAEVVILSVGLGPSTAPFAKELTLRPNQTLEADANTLATALPGVYVAGDAVSGPSMIVKATAQGKRAAHYLNLHLQGLEAAPAPWEELPAPVAKALVHAEADGVTPRPPLAVPNRAPQARIASFEAYEGALTEAQARQAAARCLDCALCSQCLECVKACPAEAIDFSLREEVSAVTAGAVILAGGFEILDPAAKPLLGYGRFANVISAPQMDRLLAPTRPFNGVIRPSDGKEPEQIAMVLCSGSRDQTVCNPICCRLGCMAAIKQAQLLMGALPLAEVTIYYIDIRAFGKGYDEFFEQAKGMGVKFVKGKVAEIHELPNGSLELIYEDIAAGQGKTKAVHDLAVLSVGVQPNRELLTQIGLGLAANDLGYAQEDDALGAPGLTNVPGVFVAGAFVEACDIPDSVLHASAAAAQAARYLALGAGVPAAPGKKVNA